MPVNKRLVTVGTAKQSAKGAYPSAADYVTGVSGGSVVQTGIKDDDFASTWATRALEGRDRTGAVPASEYDLYAMPKSIGELLMACHGAKATTGPVSTLYTHVFTPANSLPYYVVDALEGTEHEMLKDCKLDSLEIDFPNAGACKLKTKWIGANISFGATALTGGVNERPGIDGVLRSAGGQFQLDGANVRVKSGNVKIGNALDPIENATMITPDDVFEGMVSLSVSLVLIPDDLSIYRKITTGTTGGTTIANTPLSGSLDLKWVGPPGANQPSLELVVPNLVYDPAQIPAADPKGGAMEMTVPAVAAGSATNAWTATLVNTIATY